MAAAVVDHRRIGLGQEHVFSELLQPLFGPWSIAADRSTEAGLRQAIARDSAPVLIDEFDKYAHRSRVLELFRTSSRGGQILRGTKDQTGRSYGVRHIPWFAAIESGDLWGADRNRTIRLELRKPKNRGVLDLPRPATLATMGHDLVAAAVKLADDIKSTRIDGVHGRLVESFSVPAAVHAVLMGGRDAATAKRAVRFMKGAMTQREALEHQDEPDEAQLLRDILGATVRLSDIETAAVNESKSVIYVTRSVGQLLEFESGHYGDDLEAAGVQRFTPRGEGNGCSSHTPPCPNTFWAGRGGKTSRLPKLSSSCPARSGRNRGAEGLGSAESRSRGQFAYTV